MVQQTTTMLQVYRGRLHSGEEVAVKVQRPFVLETVTVDLFLVRYLPACPAALKAVLPKAGMLATPVCRCCNLRLNSGYVPASVTCL